jgi:tRNA dimethylallyltransferase
MLYYRALFTGLAEMPAADPAVREEIEALAAREGWPAVHARLARVDPVAAARIHPNHSQRLTRALEVFRLTGQPLSELHAERGSGPETRSRSAWPSRRRNAAYCTRVSRSVSRRCWRRDSWKRSVDLYARGDLEASLPAIRAVGYRQLWDFLDGACTLAEAEQRALAATRQLAKRQFTWLRKWPGLRWIRTGADGAILDHDLQPRQDAAPPDSADAAGLVARWLAERETAGA